MNSFYKSRFKYFGQTGYILFIAFFLLLLTIGFPIKFGLKESWVTVYLAGFLLLVNFLIWRKVLFEMNHIYIDKNEIRLSNLITRRAIRIEKTELKGFKDTFSNGYTLLLIDNSDKVIARIHDYYYQEFQELIDSLGVPYIGRVPNLLDRIFKA